MKKIVRLSIITFGVCMVAGKANAQLASDQPAMTAAQMEQLRSVRQPAKKAVTGNVQLASVKSLTGAASGVLKTGVTMPAISTQGGVAAIEPAGENKAVPVPTQTIEKEKKNNK